MADFKELDDSSVIEKRTINKIFVYLESEEDVQVFRKKWFNNLGRRVEFLPAGDGGNGGCTVVVQQVKGDRSKGITAYGIVDRDSLASGCHWDAFFEPDDVQLGQKTPFGEYVFVLPRWEMENYLLHPQAIEEFVADEHERPARPVDEIIAELFDIACRMLPVVAANLLLNSYGLAALDKNFGLGQPLMHVYAAARKRVEANLGHRLGISDPGDLLDECIERLMLFVPAGTTDATERWDGLVRVLDGKLFIEWIKNHYKIESSLRYHLARLVREHELIDDWLRECMSRIEQRAA